MTAMDNEAFKPEKSEEEYHFSETETTSAFTEVPSKKNIFERIKRKNFIIAFIVIIVVLGIYKLMDVLFTSNSLHAKPKQSVVANKQPIAITTTPVAPIQAPQQSSQQVAIDTFKEKLNSIETNNQASIDKLSAQTSELQNTLSNLDARLNSLNTAVQDLVAQQQIAAKKIAKQKLSTKSQYVAPKPIYYVRALVPGRAWLETQHGKTVTVSLGDNLPGYGVVTLIDTNQGTLTTSSGAIIGYSPEDS